MEWQLFEQGTVPVHTTPEFFELHPWVDPAHQVGHAERIRMVVDATLRLSFAGSGLQTVSDIGCGDGSYLRQLRSVSSLAAWGYDAGAQNVDVAKRHGLDVTRVDILTDPLRYGDLITITEVLEHLLDPHGFVRSLPPNHWVIATSPANETPQWHYGHHAWAWDPPGYRQLFADAGWYIVNQSYCESAQKYDHGTGIFQPLQFQALTAIKAAL